MCKSHQAAFRGDHVGSYLRPAAIVEAREKFEAGKISYEELRAVEDKAIIELIDRQVKAGLKIVTDGEFRRSWWHLDFFWGFQNVEKVVKHGVVVKAEDELVRAEGAILTGKISGENHPVVEDFKFLLSHTPEGILAKQTLPAPAQFLLELEVYNNPAIALGHYDSNREELLDDVVKTYKQIISDLYAAGARIIQFDDCSWISLLGPLPENPEDFAKHQARKEEFVALNNRVLSDLPEDLQVNTHVCRGNYKSKAFGTGGYEGIANPLFDKENVTAYYLEYDSEKAGSFEPLKELSDGKYVVLGLITSKTGELESKEAVIERIREASKYVPLENLALGTQCGFSSTEEGNILTEEDQWKKIALIQEIVEEVWGDK
ncbi:MAG: 5-methyltetrahydropteroyltriglutamate--homocysteine S-methyltransferase [Gemella sp.]|nr:5-methyltetrahydropteroyltriglutamate--homocysteine S-methyltransferase [Gemella sp.]